MSGARVARKLETTVACLAAIALLAILALAATATPAYAAQAAGNAAGIAEATDDVTYSVQFKGYPYADWDGIYGVPGEKVTLKAYVEGRDADWNTFKVKNVTFKWQAAPRLKAKVNGAQLTTGKLPIPGTYAVKVTAFDANNKKIATTKVNLIVKKKAKMKIDIRALTDEGVVDVDKLTKKQSIILEMTNAVWGWHNNTKTGFYTWQVENLKSGKIATWNSKKGTFKSNVIIGGGSVAGGDVPSLLGSFKQRGNFKITATIYHNDKKFETVSKTVTVE